MAKITSIPRASACGIERSRNACSGIVVGRAGSHITAIRFSVIPTPPSEAKNFAPPSSAYLPVSSATPNVVAVAAPEMASAESRQAKAAVAVLMVSFSAGGRLDLSPFEHGVQELPRAEAHRVIGRQARLRLGAGDRGAGLRLRHERRVEGNAGVLRRAELEGHALVQIDELWEAGNRGVGQVALDLGPPDLVTENVEVRRASVDQPERHARVDRMQDRALPLDPQEVTSLRALDDQPFRGAREEVGHHRVHGNPPAGDRDAGLAGRDEHGPEAAPARLEVELPGRGHLPDRAVRADREHDRRVDVEVRAGRGPEVRWALAEVTQPDAAPA